MFLERFILFIIFGYLFAGNLPRIISFSGGVNNLLITEFFVYVLLFAYALYRGYLIPVLKSLGLIFLFIILSFLYGTVKEGFSIQPLLYLIRVLAIIFSATVAGHLAYRAYNNNLVNFSKFIVKTYFVVVIVSFAIFIIFPDSVTLWSLLGDFGIEFRGDPHKRRLISTYLDPNFYAAIACIPLLFSVFLFKETNKTRYLLMTVLFTVSIILTGSRSGMATLILLIILQNYKILNPNRLFIVKKRTLFLIVSFAVLIIALLPLYFDTIIKIFARTANVGDDVSAQARLDSWDFGLTLFFENPLFGLGYNYLTLKANEFNDLSGLDSSLLSILVNFGLFLTLLFLFKFLVWGYNHYIRIKRTHYFSQNSIDLFSQILIFILIVIFFTANFNDLIFYQFWLFPIFMIGSYFSQLTQQFSYEKYHHRSQDVLGEWNRNIPEKFAPRPS